LVLTAVMALFARHRVKFLAIAWIMGIFTFCFFLVTPYASTEGPHAGILHPAMIVALMVISYLQSIYPLSIPMPGYLQWGRMWAYALPAIVLMAFYAIGFALGSRPVVVETFQDIRENLFSSDLILRLCMLGTSFYYIINIFRLPHRLTHVEFPHYLIAYCSLLGLNSIFFLVIAFDYHTYLIIIYAIIFTLLNGYLCMRVLETMALELPKPVIQEVRMAPSDEELQRPESDFNEANLNRFKRMEYWMQNHVEAWTDSNFTREDLCRETGINRHLALQSLRSQGYNNVHDYINRYRIDELKRRIQQNEISSLNDCLDVGFGSTKTVRASFEKLEGESFDQFLKKHPIR